MSNTTSELTAFRITRNDGTSYVTNMAKGVTLEQARAHFIGQTFTEEHPATGKETRWTGVKVEVA